MKTKIIDHATGLTTEEIERGRAWAIISYASMLTGLPLFVVPLIARDNAFALQHAKWAGACYVGTVVTLVGGTLLTSMISLFTCGILAPTVSLSVLAFLFFVPAVQGTAAAWRGELVEPWAAGELAELLFDQVALRVDGDEE